MSSADSIPLNPSADLAYAPPADEPVPARPPLWRDRLWVHVGLFLLTIVSTTVVGMRYMESFRLDQLPLTSDADIFPYAWVWHHRAAYATGLPFSLTVLGILVAHEFGHFFACRAYGIQVTLPYFIPAPTLSGTAGAILRIRGRVHSRAAMAVIAAAGPIAGFIVAIGTVTLGLLLSKVAVPGEHEVLQLQPLLLHLIDAALRLVHPATPPLDRVIPHPILVASWVGLLITSLNLVPAGQLDGGHLLYALYPRAHHACSYIVLGILALLGVFEWVGWFAWGVVLMIPGLRHPRLDDDMPLHPWQRNLLPVCILLLLLSGSLSPFADSSLMQILP